VDARAVAHEINERIRALATSFGDPAAPVDFLCECGCFEWVRLPPAAFDELGEAALLADGHSAESET
jgi:hypothetical protein